eukprot:4160975-Prymnesium_polylepis.1
MQRVSRADSRQTARKAVGTRQRSRMHSGRWAEAAHVFRPNLAQNLKMLSSGRCRAGTFDIGRIPTARGFDGVDGGPR